MSKFEDLGSGKYKRSENKLLGVFIDGSGLDRATRRINRKVDMTALLKGVSSGLTPLIARYYTIVPYEDDSRQRAFLDAVAKAGFTIVVKRLPPKGVTRQVDVSVEMASDIVAFSAGQAEYGISEYEPGLIPQRHAERDPKHSTENPASQARPEKRVCVIVCPSRELSYPISLANQYKAETVTADFGDFNSGDVMKSAQKWIDLSGSETIWRE